MRKRKMLGIGMKIALEMLTEEETLNWKHFIGIRWQ